MAMRWSGRAKGEDLERAQSTAALLVKLRVELEEADLDAVERCLPLAREDLVSTTLGHDVIDTVKRFKSAVDAALVAGE